MAGPEESTSAPRLRSRTIPTCYLCPGNGARTAPATRTIRTPSCSTTTSRRCTPTRRRGSERNGLLVAEGESGRCRVLCFSPRHDLTLSGMAIADIERVVDVWVEETIALGALPDIDSVQIFENRGAMMGASQSASARPDLGDPPSPERSWTKRRTSGRISHRSTEGRCSCDYLAQELRRGRADRLRQRPFLRSDALLGDLAVRDDDPAAPAHRRIRRDDRRRTRRVARRSALSTDQALRPSVRSAVPLFDGLPPEADRRRRCTPNGRCTRISIRRCCARRRCGNSWSGSRCWALPSATSRRKPRRRRCAVRRLGSPHGFTHLPLAFDDLTAASTKARPLTPSSMVGKWTDLSGFLPTRAALIASATSE